MNLICRCDIVGIFSWLILTNHVVFFFYDENSMTSVTLNSFFVRLIDYFMHSLSYTLVLKSFELFLQLELCMENVHPA